MAGAEEKKTRNYEIIGVGGKGKKNVESPELGALNLMLITKSNLSNIQNVTLRSVSTANRNCHL